MTARLFFFGGAGTVTGSCYLIEHPNGRLLVDCGLFQGSKTIKALNYGPFPFNPDTLTAVVLTHAHIDHSGLVPKLCHAGYRRRIFATEPTRDLLSFLLPDAGHIQEAEVERLNRRRTQRGERPVAPIYTAADAKASLQRVRRLPFHEWEQVAPGTRIRFWRAGHILGAASIEVEIADDATGRPLRLLFSGDLGPAGKAFHPASEGPNDFDHVIVESTYGNQDRPSLTAEARRKVLADEVRQAMARGGNLLIPAFAVERTQELLFDLGVLFRDHALPDIPVFIDSPLATRATEVFAEHTDELGEAADARTPFHHPNFRFVEDVEASKRLNHIRSGAIIMAASGMCDAGRIRHHLKAHLWRQSTTVLLTGYQAPGTLGRLLGDGATAVRIHGEEVQVRAKIRRIDVYSAHADREELIDWVAGRLPIRRTVSVTHGEPAAVHALRTGIEQRIGGAVAVLTPPLDSNLVLDADGIPRLEVGVPRLPPAAAVDRDWHNEYAAFLLRLNRHLRGTNAVEGNEMLLRRLVQVLEEADRNKADQGAGRESLEAAAAGCRRAE
ncbi:MAG TPA: MBL fold metallo-hydrolase [Alphaproteobacteria bacterium]|nr:MBL fold metallo-hydrolase [Alphaproteobacteria bacterium]